MPVNSQAKVHFKVSSVIDTAVERHTLLLLAGDKYDPYTDSITLKDESTEAEKYNDAEYDRFTILKNCGAQLEKMVEIAKAFHINLVARESIICECQAGFEPC